MNIFSFIIFKDLLMSLYFLNKSLHSSTEQNYWRMCDKFYCKIEGESGEFLLNQFIYTELKEQPRIMENDDSM